MLLRLQPQFDLALAWLRTALYEDSVSIWTEQNGPAEPDTLLLSDLQLPQVRLYRPSCTTRTGQELTSTNLHKPPRRRDVL